MGLLEKILESNKMLSEQISALSDELSLVKEKIDSSQRKDKLILEFSDNETLNISITAKVLGIKQTELDEIIQKGLLQSVGKRKQIFLAKDVLKYIKQKEKSEKRKNIYKREKKKSEKKLRKNRKKSNLKLIEIAELIKINDV